MRTSTKVILAATAIAVLSSSAMAQNWRRPWVREPWVPVSTENVFWGLAYGPVIHEGPAYGSVVRTPSGRLAPGPVVGAPPLILDCVHVPFPQCSNGN